MITFKTKVGRILLGLLIGVITLTGCKNSTESRNETRGSIYASSHHFYETPDGRVYIYLIDSCEYIGHLGTITNDILTHKGNCKFCEERKKQTLKGE